MADIKGYVTDMNVL